MRQKQSKSNKTLGQSTTEYILILAVMFMIVMKFKGEISKQIGNLTSGVGDKLNTKSNDLFQ